MARFEYTRGVLHTFFRVQDRFRSQYVRNETPHLGTAQTTAACDYPLDPCAWVEVGTQAKYSVKRRLRGLEESPTCLAGCRRAQLCLDDT
jgi:hypothetical protein